VLILLYCCVTMPPRYAVRSAATPQATEKAEMTSCAMLKRFVKMQASWVCLKLQTKPIGCADSAVLLCDNAF